MSQVGIANLGNIPPPPGSIVSLTGDTGGPVFADASNNINVKGGWTIQTDGNLTANTLNIDPSIHGYPNTPYVVGPPYFGGQIKSGYLYVQDVVNELNPQFGPFTITVQAGHYAEDLNLDRADFPQNLSIRGDVGFSMQPTIAAITFQGSANIPVGCYLTFENIYMVQSSGNFFTPDVGASNHSFLMLKNCNFNITDGYVIGVQNWEGTLIIDTCGLANNLSISDGFIDNTGGSAQVTITNSFLGAGTANSMNLFGETLICSSQIDCPVVLGTGCTFECENVQFFKPVTISGNATGTFRNCTFTGGASAAITNNSTGAIEISHCTISSTNNPAIAGTGAGTIKYDDIIFLNNAAFANTLTTATSSWQPYSKAIASTDGTKVGTAAFNSAQFTVDSNGFVSLVGGGSAIESVALQTGTSPIVPLAGQITFNGAVVAAGTHPVRTDGTGANTMVLEVQTSQAIAATDATKIGLSNFDSARFTVDANGFVSVNGSGLGETITGNSGGALSPTAGNWNIVTSNASVKFVGSGSTLTQNFGLSNLLLGVSGASITSGTMNVALGFDSGGSLSSGTGNVAIGYDTLPTSTTQSNNTAVGNYALLDCTTGTGNNTAIGQNTLPNLLTGSNNTVVGQGSGGNYTSSETNNIILGYNIGGTNAESNVIRIGNGSNTACYVTGIDGVNVGSVAKVVTEASNQLGTATITAGSGIVVTPTANTITIAATSTTLFAWTDEAVSFNALAGNGYFITAGSVVATLPAAPTQGQTIAFFVDTTSSFEILANTGQFIRIGSAITASAGNAVSNARGDTVTLVYRSSDSVWCATQVVGTWTLT